MRYILNLFARGFGRGSMAVGRIQWQLNRLAAIYVGVIAFCVFLAAHEKNAASWVFLLAYIWIALNVLPYIWAGFKTLGRRYGAEWSEGNIRGATKVLLVFGAFPFFYTGVLDTSGHQLQNLVLLVAIIPTMAFCAVRWPKQETAFTVVGLLMCAVCLVFALTTVFNTVERKLTDPATQEMQAYQQELEASSQQLAARVAKDLIAQKKEGKPFTPMQQAVWDDLQAKAKAQSLRPTDLKGKVEEFVGEANPADKSWWKQYGPLVGGLVIGGIALAVYSRRRLAGGSTAGTAHAAPAGAHAPAKKGWVGKILFILIAGGLGYLYVTERIWYSKERDVMIEHLGDQQVCGLPGNTWLTFRVVNPVVVYAGRPGERPSPFTLTDSFRMVRDLEESPKRFAHPGEVFRTNQFGCTAWSLPLDDQGGKVAINKELAGNKKSVLLHFESVAPWRWHK